MSREIGAVLVLVWLAAAGCNSPDESGVVRPGEKGLVARHAPPNRGKPEQRTSPPKVSGPAKNSPDYDPDEEFPAPQIFAALHTPRVLEIGTGMPVPPQVSTDRQSVTFTYLINLRNESCVQIGEVDIAGSMIKMPPSNQPFLRDKISSEQTEKITRFENLNVPHTGAFEPYADLKGGLIVHYSFPIDMWRTDTTVNVEVKRAVAVADKHNLHDIGNMIEFILNNHTADVERAILKDPSLIGSRDSEGTTPMLIAIADGTPRLARFMMAHGGDIHATNKHGEDAMLYAASGNNPKMLDFALSQGFSVDPKPCLPMIKAATLNAQRSVQWLIAHHGDVNRADSAGYTPLARATYNGNMPVFNMLLAAKPDAHCHTKDGQGLIQLAGASITMLDALLKAGVPVEDPNPETGQTAFMKTALYGQYKAAKWLLDHGADLKATDKKGHDVFYYARESNTLHTDQFFRQAMGDLSKYGD